MTDAVPPPPALPSGPLSCGRAAVRRFTAMLPGAVDERTLLHSDARILEAIGQHCGNETGEAFPSHQRLAELTGYCARTVRRRLRVLRGEGWVEWKVRYVRQGAHLRRSSNTYRLRVPETIVTGARRRRRRPNEAAPNQAQTPRSIRQQLRLLGINSEAELAASLARTNALTAQVSAERNRAWLAERQRRCPHLYGAAPV